MAVLHFHEGRLRPRHQKHRPYRLAKRGRWTEPDSSGLATGMMMTSAGLALLAGFAGAEFAHAAPVGLFLLFFGCPLLVFGGMMLLVVFVASIVSKLKRVQSHCGRCRFYQPLDKEYTTGRCRADPRERMVLRTDGCPFFDYSERAMVRDRFAQRARATARAVRYLGEKRDARNW